MTFLRDLGLKPGIQRGLGIWNWELDAELKVDFKLEKGRRTLVRSTGSYSIITQCIKIGNGFGIRIGSAIKIGIGLAIGLEFRIGWKEITVKQTWLKSLPHRLSLK